MADLNDIQATDAIRIVGATNTGLETTPVNSSLQGDLFVKDVMNVAGTQGALSVTTTAIEAKVGITKLVGRKSLTIQPINGIIYWGYTNTVSSTIGSIIYKGQSKNFAIDDAHTVFIVSVGTIDTRITEG
jgi:hypothetical protein